MLDGILNRGFSGKCKSVIKATRTRIEVVRRRAEAKQRFLKEDLAKLLTNGLDINAYGRTEEFLAGLNLLTCYDFIEYSCNYLVKHLSSMQKQRECPEECREAVASFMFAAARFSDLPELRDLRDLFQERYGSSLECFVNQKFVELLSLKPPILEKRLQLLNDIASEFSIKWDSRGFEQRMAAPSTVAQALPNKHGPATVAANKYHLDGTGNVSKSDRYGVSSKEASGLGNDGYRKVKGGEVKDSSREELDLNQGISNDGHLFPIDKRGSVARRVKIDKHELSSKKDDTFFKDVKSGSSSHRKRLDNVGCKYSYSENGIGSMREGENVEGLFHGQAKMSPKVGGFPGKNDDFPSANDNVRQKNQASSKRTDLDDVNILKFCQNPPLPPPYVKSKNNAMPPPYVKHKVSKHRSSRKYEQAGSSDGDGHSLEPSSHKLATEEKPDSPNDEEEIVGSGRNQSRDHQSEQNYPDDHQFVLRKPNDSKHRSSRKYEQAGSDYDGHSLEPSLQNLGAEGKPDSPHDGGDIVGSGRDRSRGHQNELYYQNDQFPLPKPRSARRKQHKSSSLAHAMDAGAEKRSSSGRRRGNSRKGLQILLDDEHSRKDDEERMIDKLLMHYSKKPAAYDARKLRKTAPANPSHRTSNDTGESSHDKRTDGHHLGPEATGTAARSISLPREEIFSSQQPKKVFTRANSFQPDGQAKHVHPKLPDYDDLAARFAALKGL